MQKGEISTQSSVLDSLLIIKELFCVCKPHRLSSAGATIRPLNLLNRRLSEGEKLGLTAEEELQGRERDAAERGENCERDLLPLRGGVIKSTPHRRRRHV